MADYQYVQIAQDFVKAIHIAANALKQKNEIELERQKREWRNSGGTSETFVVK